MYFLNVFIFEVEKEKVKQDAKYPRDYAPNRCVLMQGTDNSRSRRGDIRHSTMDRWVREPTFLGQRPSNSLKRGSKSATKREGERTSQML